MNLKEKCGVFGVSTNGEAVFPMLYWGMLAQNHRGHQSHGFATWEGQINSHTQLGLIPPNIGDIPEFTKLKGDIGIANVRYATSGSLDLESRERDAMPCLVESKNQSVSISFNGNIVNVRELQNRVGVDKSYSDTHAIAILIQQTLALTGSIEEAAKACMTGIDGSFAIIGLTDDGTLFAFKDPVGVKPLCYGKMDGIHAFSSESVGLDINGIEWDHEFQPGELMVVKNGVATRQQVVPWKKRAFCSFEFAYFMRPDSRSNDKFVYEARRDFGVALARVYKDKAQRCDVVLSLPETADDSAYGFHEETHLPWERATRRHRYVTQRAFISDSDDRKNVVYRKINILKPKIEGKNLAVIDDSIVRGDTTRGVVKRLRKANCGEVHMFITYPVIIGPCFYGIDMSTYSELIGASLEPEEIAREVEADSVNYLPIDEYVKCTGLSRYQLCLGCVTGTYPTPKADELAKQIKSRIRSGDIEKGRIYES